MSPERGLSQAEAAARLAAEGPNELPQANARSLLRIAFDVVREPMFGLLLAAGIAYLVLGQSTEAVALLVFASASVAIAVVQETRSERVLEALRDLTSPRALVIRDGQRQRIPGREVVRGDIVILSEGDRVPADGRLTVSHDLKLDESLVTGESLPIARQVGDPVLSATLVVRGQGVAETLATGARSRIGQIGQSLGEIEHAAPVLQRQTRRLVRMVGGVGLVCCLLAVVLYGLWRGSWIEAALAGIALGMSMLPEEFPLVLAVFMVMGAWRLSRNRVLTRRASAIESLGAATVLCTDKTGTLTENRMSLIAFRPDDTATRAALIERGAQALTMGLGVVYQPQRHRAAANQLPAGITRQQAAQRTAGMSRLEQDVRLQHRDAGKDLFVAALAPAHVHFDLESFITQVSDAGTQGLVALSQDGFTGAVEQMAVQQAAFQAWVVFDLQQVQFGAGLACHIGCALQGGLLLVFGVDDDQQSLQFHGSVLAWSLYLHYTPCCAERH